MNKKILLTILGLFVLLGCISHKMDNAHAEESYTQEDLGKIDVRFCDKIGDLIYRKTIYIETGTEDKVRFCIYNKSDKKIPITYGFTNAGYNSVGNRVCMSSKDTFTLIPEKKTVYIEPFEKKMIESEITVLPGMSGLQMGCLTAELGVDASINLGTGGMFVLTTRKAFDLDVVIGKMRNVDSSIKILDTKGGIFSNNKKVKAQVDEENNLTLGFLIENNGNVNQSISITGKVYNALGFEKDFTIRPKTIGIQQTGEFEGEVGIIPTYKGFFTVKFFVNNIPQTDASMNQEGIQDGYISGIAKIFVFARWVVIAVIVVILLLYRAFFARRKANA